MCLEGAELWGNYALFSRSVIFPDPISAFTFQYFSAITTGYMTHKMELTFLPSPSLNVVLDGNVLISLRVCL